MREESVETPTTATLTIDELERLLTLEDEAAAPRGRFLWLLDNAAWMVQARNLAPTLDAGFFANYWRILAEDPDAGAEDRHFLDSFARMLANPGDRVLFQGILQRAPEEFNPDENDPTLFELGQTTIRFRLPDWADRWFELAGDAVGLSAPDLRTAFLSDIVQRATGRNRDLNEANEAMARAERLRTSASWFPLNALENY